MLWNPKCGLLNTSEQRDDYEQMWHQLVFVPSLDEVRTKVNNIRWYNFSSHYLVDWPVFASIYYKPIN